MSQTPTTRTNLIARTAATIRINGWEPTNQTISEVLEELTLPHDAPFKSLHDYYLNLTDQGITRLINAVKHS